MEGLCEMGLLGENFDPSVIGRIREDGYESRSGSDNMEGGSGDDQETAGEGPARKKRYHRHTPYQIQELEAVFKENPHPDEKTRLAIGKKLNLESKQVKFWFQNRRTQMKTQLERHENVILRQENDKLRIENIAIKDAMSNPMCSHCGGPAILGEVSIEEHQLRIENARLKDELNRICSLANKFLGRPLAPSSGAMGPGMANSNLELAVGRNGCCGGMSSMDNMLPMGLDFVNGISNTLPMVLPNRSTIGTIGSELPFDKSFFLELALTAMDELVKLTQIGNPIWITGLDGGKETLNHEEYMRTFLSCIGAKPSGFTTDASRTTGMVTINSAALVELFMDANRWAEAFSCMIGRTSTIDVISGGMGGTRSGALLLMNAEFQVLSPLVPARHMKFLRLCKQLAEGVWAVVDVSIDTVQENSNTQAPVNSRRLPSGCVLQDMPNGYCKVTWVEHVEYDESAVHHLYRSLLSSGMGFGAQRWVATLQRRCEFLAITMSSSIDDNSAITPSGRTSIVKLAQRMTRNFCAGVCGTVHKWEVLQFVNTGEDARLMTRKNADDPGEPPGVVLSATTSIWMPISRQRLFDFLRNEQMRSEWDILSHGGPMQEIIHIAKGQDRSNCVSLLRASAGPVPNQSNMLMLQETWTDATGSFIAYAPVDLPAMHALLNGGDSARVALLPSGFAILPDGSPLSNGPNDSDADLVKDVTGIGSGSSNGGSLLTLGFQILVNNLPTAKLTMESVETVNDLISKQIQKIKAALNHHCN